MRTIKVKYAKTAIAILLLAVTIAVISACTGQSTREFVQSYNALRQDAANLQRSIGSLQAENQLFSGRIAEIESLLARVEAGELRNQPQNVPVSEAEAEPTEEPSDDYIGEATKPIRDADAVNIINMRRLLPTVPETGNTWTQDGDVRSWGDTRRDNTDNIYETSGIRAGRIGDEDTSVDSFGNIHSITYLLNSEFSRFTGTIVTSWASRNTLGEYRILFWGDNELIYESPIVSGVVAPFRFDVDVTGVSQLRIERRSYAYNNVIDSVIGIVDAFFIP